ncbi:hypothetical protein AX14_007398 [Amanita brunnescens Koide BX004]|nr:hypothetical protein AX14_007398 [Amanita brunnescens Koide BX004]
MIRKPDPPVMVAVTKVPAGKLKTTAVQILDYNLNRFDINDRKGLEIVILTALLTFQDFNEPTTEAAAKAQKVPDVVVAAASTNPATTTVANIPAYAAPVVELLPPPPPPKPAPKAGVDRIAEMHAVRGEVNEVLVEDEGVVPDYAQYCYNLLQDDAMLFITVTSASAEQVPKVLQVVEEAKRLRHKHGQDDHELHQYVRYDTEQQKGPRRINLDDDKHKDKYKPPNSLVIHLSKIPMPELQPKTQVDERKGRRESVHKKSNSNHGSNTNASSSLSVPKPNVLARRKRSSPALTQQPSNSSPPTGSYKNSEPSSPYPSSSSSYHADTSTTKWQSYFPTSNSNPSGHASPPAPQMHPPSPPPERPVSTSFSFPFLRR